MFSCYAIPAKQRTVAKSALGRVARFLGLISACLMPYVNNVTPVAAT